MWATVLMRPDHLKKKDEKERTNKKALSSPEVLVYLKN